jgi:glutamate racemase
MNNFPIGIFDSGVGGLSVWQEIVSLLPEESTVYIGDSGHAPYGKRSADEIYVLTKKAVEFLLKQQIKLLVIACNTATVSCLEKIRDDFSELPIIGTVPVIKLAVEVSKSKRIGVLSTVRTTESQYQKELIKKFASECFVTSVGTNALVPFIEKEATNTKEFLDVLQKELEPFQKADVDTIVLGSTHFPFIEQQIGDIMGEDVHLLDSGAAIARHVKRVLEKNDAISLDDSPVYTFYTTGNAEQFAVTAKKLVKEAVRGKIERVEEVNV